MYFEPTPKRASLLLAGILLAVSSAHAQGQRPIAIVNANVLTMEGKPIQMGMVLFRNGKIVEVGKKVKVPAGAKIIDAKGGTVMPGLVSAYSRVGLSGARPARQRMPIRFRGRRSRPPTRRGGSGSGGNRAAKKVVVGLYARQKVFGELLEQGVTTLALSPSGGGFPGQGAILDPAGKTLEELTVDDAAFLMVSPANNTKSKKLLKDTFEKAKKVLEERKKPAPKPPAKKPATAKKPASKPTPPKPAKKGEKKEEKKEPPKKKPAPTTKKTTAKKAPAKKPKPKKKDPNLEVLADLLDGKRRAFIGLNSATDVLHYLDAVGDTRFKATILAIRSLTQSAQSGLLDQVSDQLKKLKVSVLMTPSLAQKPWTNHWVNPAKNLHAAGIQVGFVLGDSKGQLRTLFARLIEVVRFGLDREVALRAVTLVPATMLGVQGRVGSIKKDKDADLLLFSGDPLDPQSQLVTVWHKGTEVKKETEEQ